MARKPTLADLKLDRQRPTSALLQGLYLDKGYDYDEVRALVAEFGFTAHIDARDEEAIRSNRKPAFGPDAG